MKKIFTLILVAAGLTFTASAQNRDGRYNNQDRYPVNQPDQNRNYSGQQQSNNYGYNDRSQIMGTITAVKAMGITTAVKVIKIIAVSRSMTA